MSAGMWLGIRGGNPMPRLTYWPSCSSAATRAASSSRLQVIVAAPSSSPDGLFFDLLHRVGYVDHPVHVDPRGVHVGRVDFARFSQVLNLSDGDPARHGTVRIEVGGRRVVDEVAVPVAFERVHQREVSSDSSLQYVSDTVEFAGFLWRRGHRHATVRVVAPRQTPIGNLCPYPRGGVEGGDPGSAGTQPLGQRALRSQFQLKLAGHVLPGEFLVLPDV